MAPMDEYELMDKMEELKTLQKKQEAIKLENAMLSEHLSRVVTRKGSLQIHLESLEAEEQEQAEEEEEQQLAVAAATTAAQRRSTKRSFRVFQDVTPPPRPSVRFSVRLPSSIRQVPKRAPMSLEEKLDVVEEEIEAHAEQKERLKEENNRVLDDLRAIYQETDHSMREVASEKNSLQRDLLILAEVHPLGKLYSEDFLRFQGSKLSKKRNIREKLQEKLDLLHMELMEAEHQFATKKDLKEVLHVVDFDHLKIQKLQLKARIRDRNREFWKLKGVAKHTMALLLQTRHKLESCIDEGKWIRESICDRTPQIASSQDLINVEKKEERKLKEDIMRLIQEQDGPPQPRVLDYMRLRIKVEELRRELKTWHSKVDVIEASHRRLKSHVKYVRSQRDKWLAASPDPLKFRRSVTPVLAPVLVRG